MFSINRANGGAPTARTSRLMASVALGAAVLLGTAGCAMLATQATTLPYSPADGVNVARLGSAARSATRCSSPNEEGEDAQLPRGDHQPDR